MLRCLVFLNDNQLNKLLLSLGCIVKKKYVFSIYNIVTRYFSGMLIYV
jgi:hypothetical protein